MGFPHIMLLIMSIVLITLVITQSSKDDIQSAFSGEKSELFANQKQRGFELFITRLTLGSAVLFVFFAIWAILP